MFYTGVRHRPRRDLPVLLLPVLLLPPRRRRGTLVHPSYAAHEFPPLAQELQPEARGLGARGVA